jgi:hypothetical protein
LAFYHAAACNSFHCAHVNDKIDSNRFGGLPFPRPWMVERMGSVFERIDHVQKSRFLVGGTSQAFSI